MTNIEFKFNLKDKVKILLNGRVGKVIGLYVTEDNIKKALIRYCDNTEFIVNQWMKERELEEMSAEKKAE